MRLDIRMPIGMLFLVFGAMLTIFGLLSDRALYVRSLGININFYWGLVMLAIGVVMVLLARAGRSRSA